MINSKNFLMYNIFSISLHLSLLLSPTHTSFHTFRSVQSKVIWSLHQSGNPHLIMWSFRSIRRRTIWKRCESTRPKPTPKPLAASQKGRGRKEEEEGGDWRLKPGPPSTRWLRSACGCVCLCVCECNNSDVAACRLPKVDWSQRWSYLYDCPIQKPGSNRTSCCCRAVSLPFCHITTNYLRLAVIEKYWDIIRQREWERDRGRGRWWTSRCVDCGGNYKLPHLGLPFLL